MPDEPRQFKTKAKNAQEAHEAIRPTSAARHPDDSRTCSTDDQFKLYTLIWKRTMACQMVPAVFDTVAIDFAAGPREDGHVFRANGSVLVEPGFIAVYQEGQDDAKDDDGDRLLPNVEEGDVIKLDELRPEQHFTEPPPRFTEASLVKTLEEYGIGRPSTYASIISTLQESRVRRDGRQALLPDGHRPHRQRLPDRTFHAVRRLRFHGAARGRARRSFARRTRTGYRCSTTSGARFTSWSTRRKTSVTREQVAQARELGTDPKTGKPVTVRMGRYGPFVQIGTKDDEEKPKFAGLRPGQKMNDITLDEALELFKLPRKLGETPDGLPVSASVGRFGPYVRYGDKYVSIRGTTILTRSSCRARWS